MTVDQLLAAAKVAALVAVVTSALLLSIAFSEKFRYANRYAGLALGSVAASTAAVTGCFLLARPWWVVVWLVVAGGVWWSALEHLTRTYPRRELTDLTRERLRTVLGPDWSGQLSMQFDADNSATGASTSLPAKLIPSDVAPRVRSVLSETLSGTWTVSSKGTSIEASRQVVQPDPPALKNLKDILLTAKAFTTRSRIAEWDTNDAGTVTSFTVKYDTETANDLALGQRKRRIEDVVRERLDPGPGSWVFDWQSVERICAVRLSVFKAKIYNEPDTTQRFLSRPEVIQHYPQIALPLGVDEFGDRVTWRLVGKGLPHGVVVGSTGAGKSSAVHTIIAGAALAGICVIIADFKADKEYDGFRDWPNVHLVAQDTYSCLRAISYVEELMNQRKTGGKSAKGAPDAGVPVLFILDEYAVFSEKLRNEIWPEFRKADAEANLPSTPPSVTSMGALYREARSVKIHILSVLQRATANYFDAEFKHNAPLKIQVGPVDGTTSQNFWDNFDVGSTIPAQWPGRALIKGPQGFIQYQGFYTPDPASAASESDLACLHSLRPGSRLYSRALFDMPDAAEIDRWDQIVNAPLVSASERPDLDPLSEDYNDRRNLRRDTISKVIDPTSMQFHGAS